MDNCIFQVRDGDLPCTRHLFKLLFARTDLFLQQLNSFRGFFEQAAHCLGIDNAARKGLVEGFLHLGNLLARLTGRPEELVSQLCILRGLIDAAEQILIRLHQVADKLGGIPVGRAAVIGRL